MNISHEVFGDVAVVHAPDELTEAQFPHLMNTFQQLSFTRAVLELDNTEIIDSAGLTAILDIDDMLTNRGGRLKIATTNSVNRKILQITRIDQRVDVFDSLVDAVKSFRRAFR